MPSRHLLVPLCALLLLAVSCTRAATSLDADWGRLEQEGRVVKEVPALAALDRGERYTWSDGIVVLDAEQARHPLVRGMRLTTDIQSPQGNKTPFVLDTGSTASWLSWDAPLVSDVYASREQTCKVVYGTANRGYWAYLPAAFMGSLRAADLPLVLTEESHSLGSAANVLGFPHFFHTQLEHIDGTWLLRSGRERAAAVPAGWWKVPFFPGLPLVRIEDPLGRETIAVLDTGAPENYALRGAPRGTYALPTGDGRATLPLQVQKTGPFPVAKLWGHEVTVLIGMDWLASHDWRMTFDRGTWAFAP